MLIKIENEKYFCTPFIELIEVSGVYGAMHGMRNPKNSWRLSDTSKDGVVGENDLKLAQTLIKGGNEHRKFLRMIHVQFDLNLPRYVWSEFDTYHFNTKNSTSTQHKLLNNDDTKDWEETELDKLLCTRGKIVKENFFFDKELTFLMNDVILELNRTRYDFLHSKSSQEKKELRRKAKQILPESWLQMRTVDTNYEELRNIYLQRRYHTLDLEWGMICKFIESLPYAKELILYGIN